MSDEDACLLDTTLAALEDKRLLDEFQFLFETWRYIHDLILIIRGMFGNPSTVDEHVRLRVRASLVLATRYVRDDILVDCTQRLCNVVAWARNRLPMVSTVSTFCCPSLPLTWFCSPHTIILVSTHVMRSSREVWSCIIPFTNLLPCRLMASCGAYLSMHLASYTVSRVRSITMQIPGSLKTYVSIFRILEAISFRGPYIIRYASRLFGIPTMLLDGAPYSCTHPCTYVQIQGLNLASLIDVFSICEWHAGAPGREYTEIDEGALGHFLLTFLINGQSLAGRVSLVSQ